MATSAVSYKNQTVYIRDSDIEEWVLGLCTIVNAKRAVGDDVEWLVEAYEDWCHIIENFPEGYKNIDLDDCLENGDDRDDFVEVLRELLGLEFGIGFDLALAKDTGEEILTKLFA